MVIEFEKDELVLLEDPYCGQDLVKFLDKAKDQDFAFVETDDGSVYEVSISRLSKYD